MAISFHASFKELLKALFLNDIYESQDYRQVI